jgi:hypothetical protein
MSKPKPKDPRGGARWGHIPRPSNTGVRGVSETIRAGRSPQFTVTWREAGGRKRSTGFTFTPQNRHMMLAEAAAWFIAHNVPAQPPADPAE